MMKKTKIFILFCFVVLCVWLFLGDRFTLNFVFALFSFLLITLSVFFTQKRKILNLLNGSSKEELKALAETYKSKQERLKEEQDEFFQSNSYMDSKKIDCLHNPQEIPLKKRKFWDNFSVLNAKTGAKIFFLPLRLLTYGVLIVGILILIHHQFFDMLAFFSGLVFANLFLIFGIIFGVCKEDKIPSP